MTCSRRCSLILAGRSCLIPEGEKALQQDCAICSRQTTSSSLAATVIYADDHWIVRHSTETNILGYLIIEPRRHFLDLSFAAPEELAHYGLLLSSVMKAQRAVLPCERIYTFTLAELVPHFHVHVIPRTGTLPRAYRGRGIMSYPLQPAADEQLTVEICSRLRRALKASLIR